MAVLPDELEIKLMDYGALYIIDPLFATHKGGELILMWQDAEAVTDYFYDSNFLDLDKREEARFFVLADYLTYIPYGSDGYAAFEGMLKEMYPAKTVGQYRFERLKAIMGEAMAELSEKQMNYIESYFVNYNKKTIDLKKPSDVASLICRYHHQCEANFRRRGFINLMQISDEHTEGFCRRLADEYSKCDTADCDVFLKEVPAYGEFTEEELQYIRSFTCLKRQD